jgi:hypothetical protein
MSIAFRKSSSHPAGSPAPAVFLHSMWRSAGTWIWNEFRANPTTMAFCEPLHEELATMTLERISEITTESWESGHTETAPYFLEFAPLIRKSHRGVAGYHRSFAFDRFFLPPGESNDRLRDYLLRLHHVAYSAGRRPVFKFVRSLGRAGWMRKTFPDATHVGILRDPLPQWESSLRLAQRATPYFLSMPVALLAMNANEPVVRAATEGLGVRLSHLRGHDVRATTKRAEAFIREATPLMTYRALLAFWLSTALASLPYMDMIVDSDRLSDSQNYREDAKQSFLGSTGIEIDFTSARVPRAAQPAIALEDVEPLHAQAIEIARSFGALPILTEKLETSLSRYSVR